MTTAPGTAASRSRACSTPRGRSTPRSARGQRHRHVPTAGTASTEPAVAVQPDGAIVLAGPGKIGGVSTGLVTRLRSTGDPDPGFQPLTVPGELSSAALLPNGKIVVAGLTPAPGGTNDVLVMRLQPNGLPDTTFSGDGRATVDLGGADRATALALQPDGRILVGVTTDANTDLVVLRLQGDALPGSGAGGPGAGAGGVAGRRRRAAPAGRRR